MCSTTGSTVFEAGPSPRNFEFDKIRNGKDINGKPMHVACTYQVKIPEGKYSSGKLFLRFKEINEVGIYIYEGNSLNDIKGNQLNDK